jgi:predicted PurR-regulated permease PerM
MAARTAEQKGVEARGKDSAQSLRIPSVFTPLWLLLLASGLTIWLVIHNLGLIFEVAAILFGALLLALALEPMVDRLERHRIPRSGSVVLLYLLLLAFIIGTGDLLLPLFKAELSTLQSQGPALWNSISTSLSTTPLIGQLLPSAGDAANTISQRLDTVAQAVLTTIESLGSAGLDIGVVFLMAYFLVVSRSRLLDQLALWFPQQSRPDFKRIGDRVLKGLGRWVRAQPIVMIYFAVGFSLSLSLLKVPYALAIGLVGGFLSVVPFLGVLVAATLGVLSALTVKPIMALWVFLIFIALAELEIHIIAPAVFGKVLKLHPAIVLMAMFIGTKAGGVIGLLYSVPTAVVAMVLADEMQALLTGERPVANT